MRWPQLLRGLWRGLGDLLAVCDPMFLALGLRDAANAARARRRFQRAAGSLAQRARIVNLSRLELGQGVVVQSDCLLHCGGLDWSDQRGQIRLGNHCYLGHGVTLYGAGGLEIGRDVLIGPGAILTSQGHEFRDVSRPIREQAHVLAPIVIGDDVWIGAGALILPGVHVGAGAVIAAGAVVSRDVAPHAVVAGVPARVLRQRGASSLDSDGP